MGVGVGWGRPVRPCHPRAADVVGWVQEWHTWSPLSIVWQQRGRACGTTHAGLPFHSCCMLWAFSWSTVVVPQPVCAA